MELGDGSFALALVLRGKGTGKLNPSSEGD